jgi:signal transduction histidine kinase
MGSLLSRRLIALDGLAALGLALLPQITTLRPAVGGHAASSVQWLLAVGTALPLVVRRVWPVPVFLIVFAMSCAGVPFGLGPASFLAAAYALYMVVVAQPRRQGPSAALVGGMSAAGAVGLTTAGTSEPGGTGAVQAVLCVVVLGAAWTAGRAVSEKRENTRHAIEHAAERARIEERLRIAREMHDVLTHSMGLIAVKAGIANHLMLDHPEEAKSSLTIIEDISRRGLREMRAMVGVLRSDESAAADLRPAPGLPDLSDLVEAAEAAGVGVELAVRQDEALPDGVAMSAFRIVQEALTNVVKHAAPTRCRVSLAAENGNVIIEVADDGPGPAHRSRRSGKGFGLVGMRERAIAHGGTASGGPRSDGGFTVSAVLHY